jgi:hypothetical protein
MMQSGALRWLFIVWIVMLGCRDTDRGPSNAAPNVKQNVATEALACNWVRDSVAKSRTLNPALADAAFTDYKGTDPGVAMFSVRWNGQSWLLPEAEWQCLLSWEPKASAFALTWHNQPKKDRVSLGPMIGNEALPDVFAKGAASEAGKKETLKLFGRVPDLNQLLDEGFSQVASAYQCSPEHLAKGIRLAIALIATNAAVALSQNVQAFRSTGKPAGRLLVGQNRGSTWRMTYDYHRDGKAFRLEASSRTKAFIDALVHFTLQKDATATKTSKQPISTQCAELLALTNQPTVTKAQALKAKAVQQNNVSLRDTLDAYLQSRQSR